MRLCCAANRALLRLYFCLGLCGILPGAGTAEGERKLAFDLPAGNAEVTLKQFARQAGRQVIYPTHAVAGIRTHEAKGQLSAREALERMLAGTPLVILLDELSGAFSVNLGATAPPIVELPLYVVEEKREPHWRYAAAGGLEVLSSCPDDITRRVAWQNFQLMHLLELILPARFRLQQAVPTSFVLYDSVPASGIRELVDALQKSAGGGDASWNVRLLPNYRFWDRDATAIFFLLGASSPEKGRLALTESYLRHLLAGRTPALPPWFVEGMLEFYRTVSLETPVLLPAQFASGEATELTAGNEADPINVVNVRPLPWPTDAGPAQEAGSGTELLPLAVLFAEHPPRDGESPNLGRWRRQAALFIRWALEDATGRRREALWQWLDQSARGVVGERDFQRCFGLDYSAVRGQLAHYLKVATKKGFVLRPSGPAPIPTLEWRDATALEISRLNGDLMRMEIPYVREFFPALTQRYIDQAKRVLGRGQPAEKPDPYLAGLLGLCECDAGNDAGARPLLAQAAEAGVPRPRIYYELARIDYARLKAARPDRAPNRREAAAILALLDRARRQAPPLGEAYELAAEIWLRSGEPPERGDFSILEEGLAAFPRRSRLLYSAALLHELNGDHPQARELAARGLRTAIEPADRERFAKLQAALAP